MKLINKVCGKIGLLSYLFCLYYLWHLCQYGGIRRHLPFIVCGASVFLMTFVWWLISWFMVRKGATKSRASRILFRLELLLFLAGTFYFGGRIVYSAIPYNGALSWKVQEWFRKKEVTLKHHNIFTDGPAGILEDLDAALDLPEDLYVTNTFQITFDDAGEIQTIEAFLYGVDTSGERKTYLVSYDASSDLKMTVWLNGNVSTYGDPELENWLTPMLTLWEQADVRAQVADWQKNAETNEYELQYAGQRSFSTTDGLLYLSGDVDGDGVQSGISDFSALQNGGTVTGYTLSLSAKSDSTTVFVHYMMEPEYTSQQEIRQEEILQQTEEAKEAENWSIDQADGTMYYFLDDQTGWRLVVTDAAAGSRFYEMERTEDGGTNWIKINQDPFGGSIGVTEGLLFLDENFGYAGLTGASQSYSRLYVTRDGGYTFEQVELPMDSITEIPALGQELGYVVSDYDYYTMPVLQDDVLTIQAISEYGEQEGYLFQSADQGLTWTYAGIFENE